jgi:hypothetical protein
MDNLFLRIIRQWLPIAVAITGFCFILFLVAQQDIRLSANDPQIQIAEDTSALLASGKTPSLPSPIDISQSLAPFIITYDLQGNVISSSARLNGKTPALPTGALNGTKGTDQPGENRITWQPQEGVRLATVIVRYDKGYVLAGRNMREIEIREEQQYQRIFLGYLVSLIATLSCVIVVQTLLRPKK